MKQQFASQNVSLTSAAADRVSHAKDQLISDGRDSVQLGLEVAAGQAALAVLRAFVVPAKTSLVDKLTGKGYVIRKIANSTYGSLAIAATAHVVVSILAPNNERLGKVVKLALNAAMVEAAATIPMQKYVDQLADKLFHNPAVDAVMSKINGGKKED